MKKTKIALTLVCAVLLVAASVMGTLAYLTASTDKVTNTFTVGNVSFGDGLDEAKVDEYGVLVENDARVTENTYKLIPGHNYTKDPTVHMSATTEDAYLFVTVANEIKDIEADTTIAAQMAAKGWKEVKDGNDVVAYVYCGTTAAEDGTTTPNTDRVKVTKNQNIVVFDEFTLTDDADVSAYENKTITIKAYAIQADGFDATTTDLALYYLANPAAAPSASN